MASNYSHITDEQAALIASAPLFFVASAAPGLEPGPKGVGPVNVSPRGGVRLHILGPNHVAFLDYIGSGNETSRHAELGGLATIMFCSFEPENAAIVRLYGTVRATPVSDSPLGQRLIADATPELPLRPRQVIEMQVESTSTSCGYGVPVMQHVRERDVADRGRAYKA